MDHPRFQRHDDLSALLGQDYFLAVQVDIARLEADLAGLPAPCIVDLRLLGDDIDNARALLALGFSKISVLAMFSLELPEDAQGEAALPETAVSRDPSWIGRHAVNLRLGCFALNPHITDAAWLAVHRGLVEKSLASPGVFKFFQDDGFVSFTIKDDTAFIDFFSVLERRRGTGSALMRRLSGFATARSVKKIQVVTECENTPACLFYQKNGFRLSQTASIFHYQKS